MFEGLRFNHWQTELRPDGLLVLTLDCKDRHVNVLSQAVIDELGRLVERIAIEPPRGVIFRSGKGAGFAVGADIKEFQSFDASGRIADVIKNGQRVFQKIAGLPCVTVAVLHGHCMGGGTELALACRYRVASKTDSTRIALPEIKLGIFPGWGGSVRLPRLIGAPAAMDMMLTGRSLPTGFALAAGLIDRAVEPAQLLEVAGKLAWQGTHRSLKQRLLAWSTNLWPARQILAPILLKQVRRKVRKEHYPAPYALIETWRRSGGSIEARLAAERRAVVKLAQTPTARNLVRVFFLQERLKGWGGKEHGIARVHVVGAGVMGGDIAAWCAYKGFEVSLQDREMAFIEAALQRAGTFFEKKIKREESRRQAKNRLKADLEGQALTRADLVIEAIVENLQAKRELLSTIEPSLPAHALLTTNTSSIPLAELRQGLQHDKRFAGLHYFNPVALMPLVEIVRHDHLDAETERRLAAFCRALDKLPLPVAGSPGFLVNRILMPYMLEAIRCLDEGIPGPVIDRAAVQFGMPMGPIELADTVGLDVASQVGKILADFLKLPIPATLDRLLAAGKRGRKDRQGFYLWENGKPKKPEVSADYLPPEDLTDRLLLPLLNEAVACWHEGVAEDADLLDAGVIFGTGFAPFRGGPLQHIRSEGAARLKTRLEQLATRYGDRFLPRPGWDALQAECGSRVITPPT